MNTEEWRAITGYEGLYEVSSLGRVRSLPHWVKNRYSTALRNGRILRQTSDRAGYLQVNLSKRNVVETKKVHRLVAFAFLGEPPCQDAHVNHIDFKKDHNATLNLEWCTRKENRDHAVAGGRFEGSVSPARGKKITAEIATSIRLAKTNGERSKSIAKRLGLTYQTVDRIVAGKIWTRASA